MICNARNEKEKISEKNQIKDKLCNAREHIITQEEGKKNANLKKTDREERRGKNKGTTMQETMRNFLYVFFKKMQCLFFEDAMFFLKCTFFGRCDVFFKEDAKQE
jgi:hypothetical protein